MRLLLAGLCLAGCTAPNTVDAGADLARPVLAEEAHDAATVADMAAAASDLATAQDLAVAAAPDMSCGFIGGPCCQGAGQFACRQDDHPPACCGFNDGGQPGCWPSACH